MMCLSQKQYKLQRPKRGKPRRHSPHCHLFACCCWGGHTPSLSPWRLPIPLAAVTNNAAVSGNDLKLRRVGRLQRFVAVGGVELSVALEACKECPQSR